jgi:hypothetical protein
MGVDFSVGRSWVHLGSARDAHGSPIFRPFGTLESHYDLSAFLGLAFINLFILSKFQKIKRTWFWSLILLLCMGLAITINVTAWIFILLTLSIIFFSEIRSAFLKVRLWQKIIFICILCMLGLGLAGILVASQVADLTSKASSLSYRFIFLINTIAAVIQKPWGWGWVYGYGGLEFPFWGTADNYYLWYTAWGGIPFGVLLVFIYFYPALYAFYILRHSQHWNEQTRKIYLALAAWILAGAMCGISNGFFAVSGSTSTLFWIYVGCIFKIPLIEFRRMRLMNLTKSKPASQSMTPIQNNEIIHIQNLE